MKNTIRLFIILLILPMGLYAQQFQMDNPDLKRDLGLYTSDNYTTNPDFDIKEVDISSASELILENEKNSVQWLIVAPIIGALVGTIVGFESDRIGEIDKGGSMLFYAMGGAVYVGLPLGLLLESID